MASREEILDELDHLSTVEHALCAEYLFLHCALGDNVPLPENPTDVERQVGTAAAAAFSLADGAMRLLRRLSSALGAGGRRPNVRRATHVRREAQAPLALAPLTAAQLTGFLDREYDVAVAVDARYARLPTPADPPAGGGFDTGLTHEEFGISPAVSAMMQMGDAHTTLVARALLPALALPDAFVAPPV